MYFRPYPVLSLFAAIIFAACIALGVWQAGRAQWKRDLTAQFEAAEAATPVSLSEALCGSATPLHQVIAAPAASGPDLRIFGQDNAGEAGWRHFSTAPGCAVGSAPLLLETGFEPLPMTAVATEVHPTNPGPPRRLIEAFPAKPMFATSNSPERNEWLWFDAPAMAKALGVPALDTRYVLSSLDGLPAYLSRTPPSRHIGYSVTWFGMAAALLLVYAAFHARAGRLRFRKDPG